MVYVEMFQLRLQQLQINWKTDKLEVELSFFDLNRFNNIVNYCNKIS